MKTVSPWWRGLTTDHIYEQCPALQRSIPELARMGWENPSYSPLRPEGVRRVALDEPVKEESIVKAKTVWWVTCSDCRNNGLCELREFSDKSGRVVWQVDHKVQTGHHRFAIWERTEGLARESA